MPGKKGTIVIDPGHGGTVEVGGSSPNNARTPSGVLEKNMALRFGFLVREALEKAATVGDHTLKVLMTREADKNLGLADRARLAKTNSADLFLSIHFNASEAHNARGVETWIDKKPRNTNFAAESAYAQKIQAAVFNAIKAHDTKTKDRGVKNKSLMVLNDLHLGTKVRACLLEMEFIDRKDTDELLNLNANAPKVREDIATAIANALVAAL